MAASTTAVVEGSGQPVSRGVPDLRATETANAVTGVEDSRLPVSGGVSDTEAAVTANAVASVEDSRQQAAVRWREIQDKYAAVKCQGHDEPCVLRQVCTPWLLVHFLELFSWYFVELAPKQVCLCTR
jgi:hypothetical protein